MAAAPPVEPTFVRRARRAQLVEAAIGLIAEVGLDRASTVRVAERAGTSRGVLTHHFRDRADLLEAVVEEVYGVAGDALRGTVEGAASPREALAAFVGGSVGFYGSHPDHMAALGAIFRGAPEVAAASARDRDPRHAREATELGTILRAGQEAGELRAFDVGTMVVIVRAVLDAGLQRVRAGDDVDALRAELVEAVDRLTRV